MPAPYQRRPPPNSIPNEDGVQALLRLQAEQRANNSRLQSEETQSLVNNTLQQGKNFADEISGVADTYVKGQQKAEEQGIRREDLAMRRSDREADLDFKNRQLAGTEEYHNKMIDLASVPKPKETSYIPQETSEGLVFINPKNPRDVVETGYKPKPKEAKDPAANQFAAAQYGRRIESANKDLDELEKEGFERASVAESVLGAYAPNALISEKRQRQNQAERSFANAILRKESGAAISKSEFDSAEKQYFPRAGDSPEVLAQKKQNREQSLAGLQAEASGAWEKVPSVAKRMPEKPASDTAMAAPGGKQLVKKQYSKSQDKTKLIYSDGTEELVDGAK